MFMKQKLTLLSKTTKAVVIPNTILKDLDNPEEFDLVVEDGNIILRPIEKVEIEKKPSKILFDSSLDLYKVDK